MTMPLEDVPIPPPSNQGKPSQGKQSEVPATKPATMLPPSNKEADYLQLIDAHAAEAQKASEINWDYMLSARTKLWEAQELLDKLMEGKTKTGACISSIRHTARSGLAERMIVAAGMALVMIATQGVAMQNAPATPVMTTIARLELARKLLVSGKHTEAITAYESVYPACRGSERRECMQSLADCYISTKDYDKALSCANKLMQQAGGMGRAHTIVGIVRYKQGDFAQAKFALETGRTYGDHLASMALDSMSKEDK